MLLGDSKTLLRNVLFGFGVGLIVMLGLSYGTSMFSGTPAAATSPSTK